MLTLTSVPSTLRASTNQAQPPTKYALATQLTITPSTRRLALCCEDILSLVERLPSVRHQRALFAPLRRAGARATISTIQTDIASTSMAPILIFTANTALE